MDDYDLYARFYDLDFGNRTEDLEMYRQFARRCGSPILELACGTGRVLLPLAEEGYRITGIDVSPAMLAVARRKAEAAGLTKRVTLVEQDMRRLDLPERFKMIFVAASSFSHLVAIEDQLAALRRARDHLHPEGCLILDMFHPHPARLLEATGQVTLTKIRIDPHTDYRLVKYVAQQADLGRQTLHVTFIVDEMDAAGQVKRTLFPFTMRFFYRYELELLLRLAGFEIEALYGSCDLDEFNAESENLIFVARPA